MLTVVDNIDPMSRRISPVTPIRLERQPCFRKHYKYEYSCQCGEKLDRKWKYCPWCGGEILWKLEVK